MLTKRLEQSNAEEQAPATLPKGFVFPCLSILAGEVDGIANALICENTTNAPVGLGWFCRVDRMLRSEPVRSEVLELANAIQVLRTGPDWELFLQAITVDARATTDLRRRCNRLRSLWGTTPIISLYTAAKADRSIGVEAETLVFTSYYVTRDFDISLSDHIEIVREAGTQVEEAFYWLVLVWAMLSFDVFFFFNDRGILSPNEFTGRFQMGIRHEEMALLRRAEKLLYTLPYGADYRTRKRAMAVSKFNFCMDCPSIGDFCFCNDDAWPAVFHTIAAYATAVLGAGLALRQIPGCRRLEAVAIDTDTVEPSFFPIARNRKLRLLHVPNHPHFKGTHYLEQAIARLPAGAPVEFTLASEISNAEVLGLMRNSDLVVDQLIGGHFGYTALEAMACGKPVIVYIADWETVISPEECPLINANPDTIFDVLTGILAQPEQLTDIGRRSRRYVEKYYSIAALADRLRELYQDTAGIQVPFPSKIGRE